MKFIRSVAGNRLVHATQPTALKPENAMRDPKSHE
jgi:hypothetical protein